MLEVILTRIFAVTLWYYFGFLVISLALAGLAASAVLCFLYPDHFAGVNYTRHLALFAFLFAIFTPASVFFHLHFNLLDVGILTLPFFLILSSHLLLLFFVFFSSGMCISIVFFRYGKDISTVYFFNLIGSSVGSSLVILFISHFSPFAIIFLISSFSFLASWLFVKALKIPKAKMFFGLFVLGSLVLFAGNDTWRFLAITSVKSYSKQSLQKKQKRVLFEKWSPLSYITVHEPKLFLNKKHEVMEIRNDAGAPARLLRFDKNPPEPESDNRWNFVYGLKKDAQTLIIGSGGGLDVYAALASNAKSVTAVEIDPVVGDLVTDHFADYIGHIFEDPRVTLHIQEGRSFVAQTPNTYDIIQITMVDSWGGGATAAGEYLFSENNLYTIEAIHDYISHLKPEGILSISRYYQYDEALRITNTMVSYLEGKKIKDIHKRLVILCTKFRKQSVATIFLKNGLFTPEEIKILLKDVRPHNRRVIYAPHLPEKDLKQSAYDSVFRSIINPVSQEKRSRDEIVRSYPRNIAPSTDDKPFFFFTQHFRNCLKPNRSDHAGRRFAIPVLLGAFFFFCLFCILTIFLPLRLRKTLNVHRVPGFSWGLSYFAAIGVGYMLIEISLIQRLTLFLGHPTYSFVIVLTFLLFSSGLGSLMSGFLFHQSNLRKLKFALKTITVLGLLLAFLVYFLFMKLLWLDTTVRILLAIITIFPLGFFMGMCFPLGIQIIRKLHDHLIPWAWGINGAFSVLASILSLLLAINFGLRATFLTGVACYAFALLVIIILERNKNLFAP